MENKILSQIIELEEDIISLKKQLETEKDLDHIETLNLRLESAEKKLYQLRKQDLTKLKLENIIYVNSFRQGISRFSIKRITSAMIIAQFIPTIKHIHTYEMRFWISTAKEVGEKKDRFQFSSECFIPDNDDAIKYELQELKEKWEYIGSKVFDIIKDDLLSFKSVIDPFYQLIKEHQKS
jgi:hypothetical protein